MTGSDDGPDQVTRADLTSGRTTLARGLFAVSVAGLSWYGMQACHEAGHVLAAWATGGTVRQVVLHPMTIARTDVQPNPHPLPVVLAGPAVGILLPLGLWLWARWRRSDSRAILCFFAGFCLVANGAYFAAAPVLPAGDTLELARLGISPYWQAIAGLVSVTGGLAQWHRLGERFGLLRPGAGSMRVAIVTAAIFVLCTAVLLGS